jgi:hypothetical protein
VRSAGRLKHHVANVCQHLPSPNHNFKTVAITAAVAVLGVLSRYAAVPYASYAAESGTVTPPAGNQCTNPKVIRLNPGNAQSGVTEGRYYVTNDSWNASNYRGLSQALYACDYNSWYVIARMNNDSGDGAVKTSPNVQETWYPTPTKLTRWRSITSQFSDVPPGVGPKYGIWEFEYDVWLNGLANSSSTEIMIWTYNNGQTPDGSLVGAFGAGDRIYDVYRSAPPRQYIAFVNTSHDLSGHVDLSDFFDYVISRGWMSAAATLYQICNGVELVSTNGAPEKFSINNFSITMNRHS